MDHADGFTHANVEKVIAMDEQGQIIMWKGRPLTELSRDELLEVAEWASRCINTERDAHLRTLKMWRLTREARARAF